MLKDFKDWTGPYLSSEKYNFIRADFNSIYCDEETTMLLDGMFDKLLILKNMKKDKDDYYYHFYFRLSKGRAEQYEAYEDLIEEGYKLKDKDDYYRLFDKWYPKKWYWFSASFRRMYYNGDTYYLIFIGGRPYLNFYDGKGRRNEYEKKQPESYAWLVKPLIPFVDYLLDQVKNTDYETFVVKHLDYRLRTGHTLYKKYWALYPAEKRRYLNNYKGVDMCEYEECFNKGLISNETATRFKQLTANEYCEMFRIASTALGYPYDENETPQENYHHNSDGRNHGLNKIDPDSSQTFDEWYEEEKHHFDHTFEMRCHNGRIDLVIEKDDRGYYLRIIGLAFNTSADVVRIYLALKNNGVLISVYRSKDAIDYYKGNSIYTAHSQEGYYDNFPKKKIKQYIKIIKWNPLEIVRLK